MRQQAGVFVGSRCRTLRYLLHLPRGYGEGPARPWPLILFLHGAGERGSDPTVLARHGIPRVVEEREDFPFVTISPQCPSRSFWYLKLAALEELLAHALTSFAVEPRRVYLTGISMGGYGTWHLAARCPERFAAIAPVCGGGMESHGFPDKVCALKDLPVWAFHGAEDDVVPLEESTRLVDRLRVCGGQVKLTVYPDLGHDSWTRTYRDPALYDWFLSHERPSARSPAAKRTRRARQQAVD